MLRAAAVFGVAAIILGFIGYGQYESAHGHRGWSTRFSVFYHSWQLLILHAPHLEPEVPKALHAGRLLGAAAFSLATVVVFLNLFRGEWLLLRLRLPWRRGHVVICGLGDLGLRLALDGRDREDKFIVAIDKEGNLAALEQARAKGILVFEGNACDPDLLRKARVTRAEFLVAACDKDATNVAVASLAGQLVRSSRQQDERELAQPRSAMAAAFDRNQKKRGPRPLVCRLLLNNPGLRMTVGHESLFPNAGDDYRINFSDLDLHETAARQAFRIYPLDFEPVRRDDETVVHLVVIGFGPMGQSLALHAARIGHFANETDKGKRLRITVADQGPSEHWSEFSARAPKLKEVCDAAPANCSSADADFMDAMVALCPEKGTCAELVTYAVCFADDELNLKWGLDLAQRTRDHRAQVLIYQTTRCGFAALFPKEGRGHGVPTRLHAFGMREDIFTWDVLLRQSEDKIARAVHEDYQAKSVEKGVHPEWDDLAEPYKESNRQAADHIPIKLRALGHHEEPLRAGGERIERFTEEELVVLAKMEHARWCAERFLDGWQYGKPTVRERKINEALVPWDRLEERHKTKDRGQIEAIPEILRSLGFGIYRASPITWRPTA